MIYAGFRSPVQCRPDIYRIQRPPQIPTGRPTRKVSVCTTNEHPGILLWYVEFTPPGRANRTDENRRRYFKILNTGHASSGAQQPFSKSSLARPKKKQKLQTKSSACLKRQLLRGVDAEQYVAQELQYSRTIDSTVNIQTFARSDDILYVGSRSGEVMGVQEGHPPFPVINVESLVTAVQVSNGSMVAAGMSNGERMSIYMGRDTGEGELLKIKVADNVWCSKFVDGFAYFGIGKTLCSMVSTFSGVKTHRTWDLKSDVLKVESTDRELVVAGCRNGTLYCIRTDGNVKHLTHGNPITGIVKLSSRFYVVSGLGGMALYDTGWCMDKAHDTEPKRLLNYCQFTNRNMNHGIALSPTKQHIAAGCDDGTVKIWNVWSGHLIREIATECSALLWEEHALFVAHGTTICVYD